MYELEVKVKKVLGTCTADPPMKPGDRFYVRDGNIHIPDGGYICMWALQSLLPLIPAKEREIAEAKDEDWLWRVHHAQCPDPQGRVVFRIERARKLTRELPKPERVESRMAFVAESASRGKLKDLRIVVKEVRGKCTSGLLPGDHFVLRSGRLYIPTDRFFCLYALQAVLPLLPAKQRLLEDGDWLKEDNHVICPDPAGNVVMCIEQLPGGNLPTQQNAE
jgi:uncharacterized repeat protein (TIGR04076 family)